jgi:hypothetical protein
MAERRQPDYDFFGPGGGPQPQSPVPPGTRQQPYGVPGPPRPPGVPGLPGLPPAPYVVPRRSRAVTALIVAAAGVVALILAGIVAAVAIPVFLNQRLRAEWRETTVSLPETFDGGARTDAPAALASAFAADDAVRSAEVAVYRTDRGARVVVVAAKSREPMTETAGLETRRGLVAGLAENGAHLTLAEADAGTLGGWFGCGPVTGSAADVCVATDHGAVVMVVVSGSDDPVSLARRMREAVVRR